MSWSSTNKPKSDFNATFISDYGASKNLPVLEFRATDILEPGKVDRISVPGKKPRAPDGQEQAHLIMLPDCSEHPLHSLQLVEGVAVLVKMNLYPAIGVMNGSQGIFVGHGKSSNAPQTCSL